MMIENKVVHSFAVPGSGERCHVYLYREKVSKKALHKDFFIVGLSPNHLLLHIHHGIMQLPLAVICYKTCCR